MIILLILIFLLVPQLSWGQSTLPPCSKTGQKRNCIDFVTHFDGSQYVGEFQDGKRSGQGIQYLPDGTVASSGIWREDRLSMSFELNQRDFPFRKIWINPPLPLPAVVSKNANGGFEMKIKANSDIFPIKAGRVVYVSPRGKSPATILIDHGSRLYSSYTSFFEAFGQFSKYLGDDVSENDPLAERIQSNNESLVLQILRADDVLDQKAFSGVLGLENLNSFHQTARRLDFNAVALAFNAAVVEFQAQDSNVSIVISHRGTRPVERDLTKGAQTSFLFPIHAVPYRVEGRVKDLFSSRPIPSTNLLLDSLKTSLKVVASSAGFDTKSSKQDGGSAFILNTLAFLGLDNDSIDEKELVEDASHKTVTQFQASGFASEVTATVTTQTDQQRRNAQALFERREVEARRLKEVKRDDEERTAKDAMQREQKLAAEVEAERKKRQELEVRLAAESKERERLALEAKAQERLAQEAKDREKDLAEARERERLLAEAKEREQRSPSPPVQVASPKNPHALIIGNAAYPGSSRLDNPINDAKAIEQKLKSMGYTVTVVTDANRQRLVQAMSQFRKTASNADLSLLFYSGHGVQIFGTNYILPIDVDQTDVAQATIQGVSLNSVVESFLPGKTKIVFLDACRDNPLQRSNDRSVSKGLAPISVAQGTLIAYATKDGQTASDGIGQKNSPFTKALLEHLSDPQDIAVILRKVREKVMTATGGKQQPWEYGSLTGGELVLSGIKK